MLIMYILKDFLNLFSGWMGLQCDRPCNGTYYGPECSLPCKCQNNGLCDPVTGEFISKFKKREKTPPRNFEFLTYHIPGNYLRRHSKIKFDNFWIGKCKCLSGFKGQFCEQRCANWKYGRNCTLDCSCRKENSIGCDSESGQCICKNQYKGSLLVLFSKFLLNFQKKKKFSFGFPSGIQCETQCPNGKWGEDCSNECVCLNNSSCDPVTGACICARGWTGDSCDEPCRPGFFGEGCKERCSHLVGFNGE